MSNATTVDTLPNRHWIAVLLLLFPALACKTLAPATPTLAPLPELTLPPANSIIYPTGIEIRRLENGLVAVVDDKGSYAFVMPGKWVAGAFHKDFIPTIDKYAEINPMIKSSFDAIYGEDNSLRIFAIDTSPEHLTKDSLTILHVRMFQEESRLQASIKDLASQYACDVNASGQTQTGDMFQGTTDVGVPFAVVVTKPVVVTDKAVYGGALLFKTDKVYLEIIYTTRDQTIEITSELALILRSLTPITE